MKILSSRLTILSDNTSASSWQVEHGFSVLITRQGNAVEGNPSILFDVGRGALLANVHNYGIDLLTVGTIVLSHGHYDHTDALKEVIQSASLAEVYASSLILGQHYSMRGGSARYIGLSDATRQVLSDLASRFHLVSGVQSLFQDSLFLADGIPRICDFENPSPLLFLNPECTVPDSIPDELVLWYATSQGTVIVTGCCHAGLVNTCEYVRSQTANAPIHAILGGFHLAGVGEARLEKTANYLKALGITHLIPCHCTGEAETELLASLLPGKVIPGYAGLSLSLP